MMTTRSVFVLGVALMFAPAGCRSSNAAASERSATTSDVSQLASATPAAAKVTKIVFVGKEHPCDCTRKTIDAGWAALQKALGPPPKMPVERIQIDTEGEKVAPYRTQKPIMALPAIYFVDGKNTDRAAAG